MHFLLLLALWALPAHSQTANRVKQIVQDEGKPVDVVYEDGRVARIYRKERLDEFRVELKLSENSCRRMRPLVCHFVLPFAHQYFAGIWKTHPTRQGQQLEYGADPKHGVGTQTFVTRSQNDLFERILKRVPQSSGQSDKIAEVVNDKSMGRIECSEDLAASMPNTREILFWDENFESGNAELAMTKGFGARVNQTWRRVEGLDIDVRGSVLKFNRFKKDYGQFTDYYPFGLSYQLQLAFRAANVIEPDDELCMLKFDVNFTQYFTQLLTVLQTAGQAPIDRGEYEVFNQTSENTNPFARKLYDKATWEVESIR